MQKLTKILLEENLVPLAEWYRAPQAALETVASLEEEYGGNIGVGHHPWIGWYVLHSQDEEQKSIALVWKERADDL